MKRNKIELWKILKKEAKKNIRRYKTGLCICIEALENDGVINADEAKYLKGEIITVYPFKYLLTGYCWNPGKLRPRIKFINQKLKLLKKFESNEKCG